MFNLQLHITPQTEQRLKAILAQVNSGRSIFST
jgi:hypothetical protein